MSRRVGSSVLAFALIALTARAGTPHLAKQRRQELDVVQKETFRRTLLVRNDLTSHRPSRGRMTELRDGSFYEHANTDIAYEALSPVRIQRMSLRRGSLLLLTLGPPSNILPPHMREIGAPDIGVPILVEVELGETGTVRDGLGSIVYLPGTAPDDDAVARCIARYPDHDAKRSAMRCGRTAD